ncbi:MAG: trans-AT polyketide synthase/acyltransferase/oxidoreductase domain-containing protein, partial [Flavobacteriales bacterium]
WYLGLSSNWANAGVPDRASDYQIWCGPSMGAFNDWVKGTYLEDYNNRKVVNVAEEIMLGAAVLYRIEGLKVQGVRISGGPGNELLLGNTGLAQRDLVAH